MSPRTRTPQRGSSFTSCLLFIVLVIGGGITYYVKYQQWNGIEKPLANLDYAHQVTAPQLHEFRTKAVASLCDPAALQLQRVQKVRGSTAGGTKKNEDFEQDCIEIKNKLKTIVDDARLRKIPERYKTQYHNALLGAHFAYLSVRALESACDADSKAEREARYKESRNLSSKADKLLKSSRDSFKNDR